MANKNRTSITVPRDVMINVNSKNSKTDQRPAASRKGLGFVSTRYSKPVSFFPD